MKKTNLILMKKKLKELDKKGRLQHHLVKIQMILIRMGKN